MRSLALAAILGWSCASAYGDTLFVQDEKLQLTSAVPSSTTVATFARFDLRLDLKATYDNPFDPDDIDVYADFVAPDGSAFHVNGFFTQDHTRKMIDGGEHIDPVGEPYWQIRFTPNRAGTWRYTVSARDRSGVTSLPEASFEATASSNDGFLRRNAKSPHIFAYDSGKPYLAVGENMCWGSKKGSFDYDEWLPALGGAGGNWIRIWMFRWNCCLEWSTKDRQSWEQGTMGGLGVYNLANAARLDAILDLADQNHVHVMLALGTYGEFINGGYFNEGLWATNPYNAENGGPCAKPEDFWTNEQARKFYRNRLRYIAARYGCRTGLFGWEFWNEAYAPTAWVAEMAQFLKGLGPFAGKPADPYLHLVSTSYGTPEIWVLPEVDFTQTHRYGQGNIPDVSPLIIDDASQHREFGKPHLMAEFGIDWRSSDDKYDTTFQGVNLHNALWSSVLSGNAGTAMIWYWDSYVHPGNLYGQFRAVRAFIDTIPWNEGPWRPLDMDAPVRKVETETWNDLELSGTVPWGTHPDKEYTVSPTKGVGGTPMPGFLYGPAKPELRQPLVMHVDYERAGRFDVRVGDVSTKGVLRFTLDGADVLDVALSANPPEDGSAPQYETTEFRKEYGIYIAHFNKVFGIDVPAGAHTIHMDVPDGDWIGIASYGFRGYVSSRFPRVDITGITNGAMACLWVHNPEHNWMNVKEGKTVPPLTEVSVAVRGLPSGSYDCPWWDTWKGEVAQHAALVREADSLTIPIPELSQDRAATLVRRGE